MNGISGRLQKPFWIRLFHWEYWNFDLLYIPIYPLFIFLCLRARSFFFYAAANPKIVNGGFLGESKKDLYELLPATLQPKTIFFTKGSDPGLVIEQLYQAGFRFPLIGKPNIGGRGRGVKKLEDETAIVAYASICPMDFHIQEFVSYEEEAGIFYYRFPGQNRGNISGIVRKEFLKVTGDGKQNIRELLKANPRGILQLAELENAEPGMLNTVPAPGEVYTVSPYGNHARGALFIDDSATVNDRLLKQLDNICFQIPEFFYGRLDIRFESRELFEQGKCFSVVEVNGAGSEPTHIYDPCHSIFFAWKEIVRHWVILHKISRANHRLGHRYLSVSQGIYMFKKNKSDSRMLAAMYI